MGYKHVEAALQAQLPSDTSVSVAVLKLTLIAICQHADNNTDSCFPSIRRLAKMTGLGKSSVARAVVVLDGLGVFLTCVLGKGHGSSYYRVNLEGLKQIATDWNKFKEESRPKLDPSVPERDTDDLEATPSVPLRDAASHYGTQCPTVEISVPQRDVICNDRSGDQSGDTVIADLRSVHEPLSKEQTESVKVKTAGASCFGNTDLRGSVEEL